MRPQNGNKTLVIRHFIALISLMCIGPLQSHPTLAHRRLSAQQICVCRYVRMCAPKGSEPETSPSQMPNNDLLSSCHMLCTPPPRACCRIWQAVCAPSSTLDVNFPICLSAAMFSLLPTSVHFSSWALESAQKRSLFLSATLY